MIVLRDYQIEAKAAVSADFSNGCNAVGVSLPTGVGKSKIMASMAADIFDRGRRSVTLLHRDTLVDQFARHLAEVIPARAIGTVKAGSNDVDAPVIVASIHTLRSMDRLRQLVPPDLTVVDEAHVSASDSYLQYFDYCDARPGGRRHAVGFTATWMRADRRGLGDVWQKISYQRTLKWAVKRGYLVPPVTYQLGGNLDLTGVRVAKDGDYTDRALEQAVMVDDLRDTVVAGYLRMAKGRSSVLFAPTTASARFFGDALREAGVRVGEIFAGTTKAARKYNFAQFDAGNIDVLITCTALAEGWDAPRCDAVLCLRPTKSAGMFVQQVGRALRPWPGKTDALVLDFVGVTDDNSIIAHIDLTETPEKRLCPGCAESPCACQCLTCGAVPCECEREDDSEGPGVAQYLAKKIDGVHEVDMFAGTSARWLRTGHGVPFIRTADSIFYLARHDDLWAVGRCPAKTLRGSEWIAWGLPSDDALDAGSEAAIGEDHTLADRNAAWRTKKARPSGAQIAYARSIGIDPDGLSKVELSDQIDIVYANHILAPIEGTA
jgi:superfamily II DNA or RNA helicase